MSLEHGPQRQGASSASYLSSKQVRARYGGISDMTLWRWLRDPSLAFPQPTIINRRRFFVLSRLDEFDARQAAVTNEEGA
jgi:predicted DNA-binding transcriptional regulator AlpA